MKTEKLRCIYKDAHAVRGKRSNLIHFEEFPKDIVMGPGILQQIEDAVLNEKPRE